VNLAAAACIMHTPCWSLLEICHPTDSNNQLRCSLEIHCHPQIPVSIAQCKAYLQTCPSPFASQFVPKTARQRTQCKRCWVDARVTKHLAVLTPHGACTADHAQVDCSQDLITKQLSSCVKVFIHELGKQPIIPLLNCAPVMNNKTRVNHTQSGNFEQVSRAGC
jgi:hypothetical protein